jgi:hypothetical protein
VFALHDDEMTDAVPAHRRTRNARGFVSFNGDHVNAHQISKSHGFTSGARRAGHAFMHILFHSEPWRCA